MPPGNQLSRFDEWTSKPINPAEEWLVEFFGFDIPTVEPPQPTQFALYNPLASSTEQLPHPPQVATIQQIDSTSEQARVPISTQTSTQTAGPQATDSTVRPLFNWNSNLPFGVSLPPPTLEAPRVLPLHLQPEVRRVPLLHVPEFRSSAVSQQVRTFSEPVLIHHQEHPVQKNVFPALEPHPEPLSEVDDPGFRWTVPDDPEITGWDLLRGTTKRPFLVDLSRYSTAQSAENVGAKKETAEELVVLSDWRALPHLHNSKWECSNKLIDYETIRFSNWDGARWPVNRRLALSPPEINNLKQIKIYGLSKDLVIILLENLAEFTWIKQIEIDELVIHPSDTRSDSTPVITFDKLLVFSIGKVKFIDRMRIAKPSVKHLKFDTPKLEKLFLCE